MHGRADKEKRRLRSREHAQKKRRLQTVRLAFAVVVAALVIFGLSRLASLSSFTVTNIEVKGNEVIDSEAVKILAAQSMKGSYLYLFSKSNRFIVPRKEIEQKIVSSYARVRSVDAYTQGSHTLVIEIHERTPFALWCKPFPIDFETGTHAITGNETCYFIDAEGLVFAKAPQLDGAGFFTFYGEFDGDPIGHPVKLSYPLNDLLELSGSLSKLGMRPIAYGEDKNGSAAFVISDESGDPHTKGMLLMFNTTGDLASLYENLQLALAHGSWAADQNARLLYLDMRYGNRIFFKTVEEELGS